MTENVAPPVPEAGTVIEQAIALAKTQAGGTLATMHSEDGTPYLTFVFFTMLPDGSVLFGSGGNNQHARNMRATPEVSFLVDNREVIRYDWSKFDRLIVEGRAIAIAEDHPRYAEWLAALRAKNDAAAYFTERGTMYRIEPHRLVLMKGLEQRKQVIDLEYAPDASLPHDHP